MARTLVPGRNLASVTAARVRLAEQIAAQPVDVTVTRLAGDGRTAPKTRQTITTFTARVDVAPTPRDEVTGAYVAVQVTALLLVLKTNDAVDFTGRTVSLERDDQLTVVDAAGQTSHYTVASVIPFRAHLEAVLNGRS